MSTGYSSSTISQSFEGWKKECLLYSFAGPRKDPDLWKRAKVFHPLSTSPILLSTESFSLDHERSTKRSKYVGVIDIVAKFSDFEHATNDFDRH